MALRSHRVQTCSHQLRKFTQLLPFQPPVNIPLPKAYYSTKFNLSVDETTLPSKFAIVTAYNPLDELVSKESNQKADERLRSEIIRLGLVPIRATGGSPDRSHCEPGWLFATDFDTANEVARSFNQRALWWIEEGQLFLVECTNPALIPIGRFRDRVMAS